MCRIWISCGPKRIVSRSAALLSAAALASRGRATANSSDARPTRLKIGERSCGRCVRNLGIPCASAPIGLLAGLNTVAERLNRARPTGRPTNQLGSSSSWSRFRRRRRRQRHGRISSPVTRQPMQRVLNPPPAARTGSPVPPQLARSSRLSAAAAPITPLIASFHRRLPAPTAPARRLHRPTAPPAAAPLSSRRRSLSGSGPASRTARWLLRVRLASSRCPHPRRSTSAPTGTRRRSPWRGVSAVEATVLSGPRALIRCGRLSAPL